MTALAASFEDESSSSSDSDDEGKHSRKKFLKAAERLEEAAHEAEERGMPMPIPMPAMNPGAPVVAARPLDFDHGHGHTEYGQPGYGQPGYGQPGYGAPPGQTGGMSDGAKMALAAGGGVAAGLGAAYVATHLDDIGGAMSGAAGAVGDAAEGAWNGMGDAAQWVG